MAKKAAAENPNTGIPSLDDFDPEAAAAMPPEFDPTHVPDAPTLEPPEGEDRPTMLLRVIARLANSCSFDMSNGQIFGQCLERLKTHQVSDEELAWAIPYVRKAVDAHVKKRDAAAARRDAARSASTTKSIEEQLG